jgi:hypothetical protein
MQVPGSLKAELISRDEDLAESSLARIVWA